MTTIMMIATFFFKVGLYAIIISIAINGLMIVVWALGSMLVAVSESLRGNRYE